MGTALCKEFGRAWVESRSEAVALLEAERQLKLEIKGKYAKQQ